MYSQHNPQDAFTPNDMQDIQHIDSENSSVINNESHTTTTVAQVHNHNELAASRI